jgi:peptidoglycan/xylan/chitin deacetylase (PgdA/CDA1 family)
MLELTGTFILGAGGLAATAAGVVSRAVFMPRSQIFGEVLFRGDRCAPARIALTFDDGPDSAITPAILECLAEHDVKGSFFVVGKHAAKQPHLVERIHREGHVIANHSYDHAHLGTLRGTKYWMGEISRTDETIGRIIGQKPVLFRPPMGFKTPQILCAARRLDHVVVTWTRRGFDGVRTTPERIIASLKDIAAGDVVALHDGCVAPFQVNADATAHALYKLLRIWSSRGVVVQRLDELLGVTAYTPVTIDNVVTL